MRTAEPVVRAAAAPTPSVASPTTIEVVLDTVPDTGSDVAFSLCGADAAGICTAPPTTFALDDDDDPALARSFAVELEPGIYVVSQAALAGSTLTAVSCSSAETVDLGRRRVLIELAAGEAQSCRFEDHEASISVTQDTSPAGEQDFTFAACLVGSADPCATLVLDDDLDPERASTGSFEGLAPGVYTLTQAATETHGLTSLSCDRGSVDRAARRVTVTIVEGVQVACTFVNQATSLAITVNALPGAAQDFHLTVCRDGGSCSEADLDDDVGAPGQTLVLRPVVPGTYTVDETGVPGWLMERITCGSGDEVDLDARRATVHLALGETTTCVFVNRAPAIRVDLDASPDSGQDIAIDACREGDPCRTVTLDDDADPTHASSATLLPVETGSWTLRFPAVEGWGLVAASCTGAEVDLAQRVATFELEAVEQVTCSVVYRQTSLTIVQNTQPDGPQDFTYTGCAGPDGALGCGEFALDDDGDATLASTQTFRGLRPASYRVSQAPVPGYGLVALSCTAGAVDLAGASATVTVGPGDQVTCHFTDRETSLTIEQDTAPSGAQDFSFTGCAGPGGAAGCLSFALDDDADATLPSTQRFARLVPGTVYSVAQAATAGYGLVALTCTNGLTDLADRRATIVLQAGEQVTCTFTDRATTLRIVQDTSPNAAQDFSYTGCAGPAGAAGCGPFSLDDDSDAALPASRTFAGLEPGTTYTVTQDEVEGYGLSTLICSAGEVDVAARRVRLVVAAGDQVTCTFTDVVTSLTVVQNTVPDGALDVTIRSCPPSGPCASVVLDDDSDPAHPASAALAVTAGRTYVVSQDPVAGALLSALVCTKGTVELAARRAVVTLAPGDRVTCTFTVRPTSLTIVQDTSPDASQDFSFTGCAGPDGALGCGTFSLDDDDDPTLPAVRTFEGLQAGSAYSVRQAAVPGFGLTSMQCDDGQVELAAGRATVVLAPGEQVTCTFVDRATSLTIVQDTSPDAAQDFSFTGCADGGARGCGSFVLDDDADPAVPASVTFSGLLAGAEYSILQSEAAGYGLTGLTCNQSEVQVDWSARGVRITPEAGDQVTCTFVDTETSLTIVNDLVNNGGQDFSYTACRADGPCEVFDLDDDNDPTLPTSRVLRSPDATTYTVTVDPVSGFGSSSVACTSNESSVLTERVVVRLEPGRQTTCTFTRWANQVTVRADVPTGTPDDFGYTVCGPAGCSHHVVDNDVSDATVASSASVYAPPAGQYTITQDPPPPGWGLVSITCHDRDEEDLAARSVTFTLQPGRQVWCEFANQETAITVVEDTVADAARNIGFSLCPAPPAGCTAFQLDDDANATLSNRAAFTRLEPGTYTVTQDPVDDAVITTLNCDAGGDVDVAVRTATITVLAGRQVTCTFVNRVPTITVVHDAVPNSGTDVTYRFCRVSTGSCSNAVLDDDTNATRAASAVFADLVPGSYTVTRLAVGGWVLTSLACSTGESTDLAGAVATISLTAAESTTCTFASAPG